MVLARLLGEHCCDTAYALRYELFPKRRTTGDVGCVPGLLPQSAEVGMRHVVRLIFIGLNLFLCLYPSSDSLSLTYYRIACGFAINICLLAATRSLRANVIAWSFRLLQPQLAWLTVILDLVTTTESCVLFVLAVRSRTASENVIMSWDRILVVEILVWLLVAPCSKCMEMVLTSLLSHSPLVSSC